MSQGLVNPQGVYPLIGIICNVLILGIGLFFVKESWFFLYLLSILLIQFIFGYGKTFFRAFPILFLFVLTSGMLTWIFAGEKRVMEVSGRFLLLGIASLTSLGMNPMDLVRNMNQYKLPRALSAGFLISLRFTTVLAGELKLIFKAMKTRNIFPLKQPKVWYRAILFPFIIRLMSISDNLSISLETRAFDIHDSNYTIYKPLHLRLRDIFYFILVFIVIILGVIKKMGGFYGCLI